MSKTKTALALGLIPPEGREIDALVTRPQGGWKWQNAFAVSRYRLTIGYRGKPVWKFVFRSRKYSEPQIRNRGITYDCVGRPTI